MVNSQFLKNMGAASIIAGIILLLLSHGMKKL